jgi:hypothetical protein
MAFQDDPARTSDPLFVECAIMQARPEGQLPQLARANAGLGADCRIVGAAADKPS